MIKSLYNYKYLWAYSEIYGQLSAQATLDTPSCLKTFHVSIYFPVWA
jgi:hypothetical protein